MRRLDPRCTTFLSTRGFLAAVGAFAYFSLAGAQDGASARTVAAASQSNSTFASGSLRVSQRNPRYFEDAQGQIVYLAGDSEMLTVMDTGPTDPGRMTWDSVAVLPFED